MWKGGAEGGGGRRASTAHRNVHGHDIEEVDPTAPVFEGQRNGGARMEASLNAVKSDGAPVKVEAIEDVVDGGAR